MCDEDGKLILALIFIFYKHESKQSLTTLSILTSGKTRANLSQILLRKDRQAR